MSALDDLLAQQAAGPKSTLAAQPSGLDAMLAAQVRAPAPAVSPEAPSGYFADRFAELPQIGTMAKNLAYGFAKGAADLPYGASQLALHGANALTGGRLQDTTSRYDQFLKNVEDTYQSDTAGSVEAGAGRVAANLMGPAKGFSAAKNAPLVARVGAGALTGGGYAATQPILNGGDNFARDKAAQTATGVALGGVLSGSGSVLGGLYNGSIRPILQPGTTVGNMLSKGLDSLSDAGGGVSNLLGSSNAQAVLDRLANARSGVSRPTTAQIAGVPELVMAENALTNNPAYKGGFVDRSIQNNASRMQALGEVAGTPEQLSAALKARSDAAGPLYDAAAAANHPIDETLTAILNRPSAQAAIARGQKLAAEKNTTAVPVPGSPEVPASLQPTGFLDASGQPMTKQVPGSPAVPGSINGQTLQYLKMGVQDLQKEGKTQGMGSHEANALDATQNDLHKWMMENSPLYKQADSVYAKGSVPINTMQVGSQLQDALSKGTFDASGKVAPMLSQFRGRYDAAMKDAPYGIDPAAKAKLDSILHDLQTETVSNSIRANGSNTVFNAQAPNWLAGQLYGNKLDGKSPLALGAGAIGGFLSGGPMGAAGGVAAANRIGDFAGKRVNSELQKALLEPEYFSSLLRDALARQASGGGGLLGPSVTKAAVGGANASLNGLLSRH